LENIINDPTYTVQDGTIYSLTVIIGNGQLGSSALKNFDGEYIHGAVNNVILGDGKNIRGKNLLITSMVTDANSNTNTTVISYKLNGDTIGPYSKDVDTDNSSISYTTTIHFT
jgi:hypothetical protein